MPNIEMWGFGHMDKFTLTEYQVYAEILRQFNKEPFKNDFVITIVSSRCFNGNEAQQPFIRICSSEQAHTERIIEILQKIQKEKGIKFDIEVQPLARFIPAEK
ncbi:MAG: hypothetical protein A2Y82_05595 [Candidatus Buchananbacteria bacterium RBG_13_36_9]|uniref:Uncharacterized protein n=1 Tax=Candidatus Buchananbacteria bacterium RBG_13_36_9 TaxID=1797530 RepID=A0A1G1XPB4_9BACT|nr:MAG: hypothetical protein A2Y82_05595 [Candidatus Buchananbacteria bacterium RBG_13_36_9]